MSRRRSAPTVATNPGEEDRPGGGCAPKPCPQAERLRQVIEAADSPVVRLCGWPTSGRRRLLRALVEGGWEGLSVREAARRRGVEARLRAMRQKGASVLVADLLDPEKMQVVVEYLHPGERLITSGTLGGVFGGAYGVDPDRVLTLGPEDLFLTPTEVELLLAEGDPRGEPLWRWSEGWLGPLETALRAPATAGGELELDRTLNGWFETHVWQAFSVRERLALLQRDEALADVFSPGLRIPALLERWLDSRQAATARLAHVGPRPPRVRLRLFGPADVSLVVGEREQELAWPFRRVQLVLALLALSPECAATRERIVATLWPDESEEVARKNLHPAVSHLRRLLGVSDSHGPAVLRQGSLYKLNPDWDWEVDVWRFEDLVSGGIRDTDSGQEARRIYRGPLLEGANLSWVDEQRERLNAMRGQMLLELAEHYAADGRFTEAEECYRSLLVDDPLLEEVHLALMRLYAARGRPDLVRRQYERLSRLLIEELGSQPMDATVREMQRLIG